MPHIDPEKEKLNRRLTIIISCMIFVQISFPIMLSCHYFVQPRAVLYPTSLLPEEWFPFPMYLIFGICLIWLYQCLWAVIIFNGILSLSYFAFFGPIMEKDFMPKQKSYNTIDALRTPKCLPIVYRSMEILHKNMISIVAFVIIPIQSINTQLSVLCNYNLIKHPISTSTVISFGWTLYVLIVWTSVLEFCGWTHSQGKMVIRSWKFFDWKNKKDLKYISKFRRSCRPLSVRAGGAYCIKRINVLKFLRAIAVGTFRALLALK